MHDEFHPLQPQAECRLTNLFEVTVTNQLMYVLLARASTISAACLTASRMLFMVRLMEVTH